MKRLVACVSWLAALGVHPAAAAGRPLAPTPPMGWNSWDSYGFTISEDQFKANAKVLASIRALGWDTAVIDEGWYMANPLGKDLAARRYRYDGHGRLVPDTTRFPSAAGGRGLGVLADWTHSRGLKFGIHIVRGIPKEAVAANLPIAGSPFRASDAADRSNLCPWDDANYGVADNPAGQAWYDALVRQYAAWGVDFIKVDCIADHPYRPSEIRQIARAIRHARRRIVLSLSPGPTNIAHGKEVRRYAQMWRIMDDQWDGWTFAHDDPRSEFPTGVRDAFDRLTLWNGYVGRGSWPDADMLPFGPLYPHPGWGEPRQSRLTPTETRTAFTLWAIARSPLILGGNLAEAPCFLWPILGNRDVIALNQGDRLSHPLGSLEGVPAAARIWVSGRRNKEVDTLAVFNLGDDPIAFAVPWTALGFARGPWAWRNLWTGELLPPSPGQRVTVAPHDVILLRRCARSAATCRENGRRSARLR